MISRITKTNASIAISLAFMVISLCLPAFAATAPAVTVLSPLTLWLREPTAVTMDANGNTYVADPRNRGVVKFNVYGKPVQTIPVAGTPQGLAMAANGNLLVSAGEFVAIIDANGAETGKLGIGAGQFKVSSGIAVDGNGYIYVVDSGDNCVQVFNAAGAPVTIPVAQAGKPANSFGTAGTLTGQFSRPSSIAYEKISNLLVVSDTINGRLQAFTTTGGYVKTIGSIPGTGPLKFVTPKGVTFDYTSTTPAALNRMYVVDTYQSNMQVIDPKLTTPTIAPVYLSTIGSNGTDNGQLMIPSDATFDAKNNRLLVVNGFGNVTVYGIDGGTSPFDNTPPTLGIDPVAASVTTPNITVTGSVEAGATLTVAINTGAVAGNVVFTSATAWKCDITGLVPGGNTITVSAKDAAWNVTSQSVSVTYIEPAPAIAVTSQGLTNNPKLVLTGSVDAGAAVTVKNIATGVTGAATVTGNVWSYAVTLTEGTNNFEISAKKPASATAIVSAVVTLDTAPPILNVSGMANGSYTNNQTQNITGTVVDANPGTVTVNNQPVQVLNGAFSATVVLNPGANTVTVQATDMAGNITNNTRVINFDATLPVITVTAPSDNQITNNNKLLFTGIVDKDATVTVAGAVALKNPNDPRIWSSEVTLANGTNTVAIVATDLYGNVSALKRTVVLDTTAPALAIKDPAQDISTNLTNITIAGTVTDNAGVTLTGSVNNGAATIVAVDQTGAFSFNIGFAQEGRYTVLLTATDAAGNVSPATRTIIYDITPPVLTVNPSAVTYPNKINGTVEQGATVLVKDGAATIGNVVLGAGSWSADLTGITYNPNTLTITATDAAGNSTVKSLSNTTTFSINPVSAPATKNSITINGTVQNGLTVTVATTPGTVADPVSYPSATTWQCNINGLVPGDNIIKATITDASGISVTQTITVTYIELMPTLVIDPTVPGMTSSANITITGTVDAGSTVTVMNTATSATGTATVAGTVWRYPVTLAEGVNSFTVTAKKPFSAMATAVARITLDSIPPVLNVSALANGAYTNIQTQNISGTVSDANSITLTFNGTNVPVVNGLFGITLQLNPGVNTLTLKATDLLGNVATDTRTVNFDASLPVIIVSNPADNSYTNKNKIVINGTLDKEGVVKVAGVLAVKDLSNGLNWSSEVGLVSGLNTISIEATDLYGNINSTKRTVTLDTAAPQLAINDPAQDISTNSPNITLSGTVADSNGLILVSSVNNVIRPVIVTNGAFSFNVDFNQEGAYPITFTATDAAGNVTTATRTLIYDITPPVLTLAPTASAYPVKLNGTVEPGASVVVKEGDKSIGTVTLTAPTWSADLTGITYDPALLTVTATDAAGNSSVKTLSFQFPDGDLNGDGKVTIADALRAIRIVVKELTPTPEELAHGDIGPLLNGKPNPNGKIDLADAILILHKAVGMTSW